MRILIVEDDDSVRNELKELLTSAGYDAIILEEFKNAEDKILEINPDLVLLDINIPYVNGEVLLSNLRKKCNIPVIMVTSKNSPVDEVLSMSYGADDYVVKPYNPTILLLRINAVLKRINNGSEVMCYKDLTLNVKKGTINKGEEEIILTKNEMIIFTYLINRSGTIVSRDEIMTDLWDNNEYINDNALTVNISRLRSKLSEIGYADIIQTRKGQGYILL